MILTWDERKRLSNLDKHGLDFADLTAEFIAGATIVPTKFGRFLAIGGFHRALITVVFARLGEEAVAVVSMRPASGKERAHAPQA